MRLHDYPASANCFKARLLIRMAGIECELVPTDIFDGATLTDAFGRLNPLRETPVLELDDGRSVWQSGAVLAGGRGASGGRPGGARRPGRPPRRAHVGRRLGAVDRRPLRTTLPRPETASLPAVARRFRSARDRIGRRPRHQDDLAPYPPHASVQEGRSLYG